jgi:hypothetical protein
MGGGRGARPVRWCWGRPAKRRGEKDGAATGRGHLGRIESQTVTRSGEHRPNRVADKPGVAQLAPRG